MNEHDTPPLMPPRIAPTDSEDGVAVMVSNAEQSRIILHLHIAGSCIRVEVGPQHIAALCEALTWATEVIIAVGYEDLHDRSDDLPC